MMRRYLRAGATMSAALALALGLTTAPALAATATRQAPAAGLRCHATMTNRHPHDYTSTGVRVQTVPYARATTVAHYKTTNHKKSLRTNRHGRRTIWYYISGATPGFTVMVSVYVSRHGRKGTCSTSFTPRR